MIGLTLQWTREQLEEAVKAGRQELGPASWADTAFRVESELYEADKAEVRSVLGGSDETVTLRWYSSYGHPRGVRA